MRNISPGNWRALNDELRALARRIGGLEVGVASGVSAGLVSSASSSGGSMLGAHASSHADGGTDKLGPYDFTWAHQHTFEPGTADRVPITITAHASQTADLLRAKDSAGLLLFQLAADGKATVHAASAGETPSARLQVTDTAEQLRLRYDATYYAAFVVDSAGYLKLDPTGNEVRLDDNVRLTWGDDRDSAIYWSGASMVLEPRRNGSGALVVAGNATLSVQGSTGNIELQGASGGNIINFTRGGVNVISASTAGGTIEMRVNGSATTVARFVSQGMQFDDNIRLYFGNGSDGYVTYNGATMQFISPGSSGSMQFQAAGAYGMTISGSTGDVAFVGTIAVDQTQMRFQERTAPGTPATGKVHVFLDSSTGELSVKKDDSSVVSLETSVTPIAVKGSSYIFGCAPSVTADRYMNFGNVIASSTVGMVMPRAGSITGVSFSISASVISAAGTIDLEVHKNGTNVFSTQITTTGTPGPYQSYAVQDALIDTFSAGDELALYINFGTFSGTLALAHGLIEYLIEGSTDIVELTPASATVGTYNASGGEFIKGDSTSGTVTINLPQCSTLTPGTQIAVVRVNSGASNVVIDGYSSETINGATTRTLNSQWSYVTIITDGSNWYVIAEG